MDNKKHSCCFTGHRRIEKDKISFISAALETETEKMIRNGIRFFYCGGAIGFDTLAEKAVIKLRKKYPDIKLLIAVPHRGQSNSFGEKERQEYDEILSLADEVIYLSESFYKGCMHARNRFMVNNSGHCICYLLKNTGGTAYTVGYAQEQGLQITNIANHFNWEKGD